MLLGHLIKRGIRCNMKLNLPSDRRTKRVPELFTIVSQAAFLELESIVRSMLREVAI
jgi:hypothetical protein